MKTTYEEAAKEYDEREPHPDEDQLKCPDCGQWKCQCVALDNIMFGLEDQYGN